METRIARKTRNRQHAERECLCRHPNPSRLVRRLTERVEADAPWEGEVELFSDEAEVS